MAVSVLIHHSKCIVNQQKEVSKGSNTPQPRRQTNPIANKGRAYQLKMVGYRQDKGNEYQYIKSPLQRLIGRCFELLFCHSVHLLSILNFVLCIDEEDRTPKQEEEQNMKVETPKSLIRVAVDQ